MRVQRGQSGGAVVLQPALRGADVGLGRLQFHVAHSGQFDQGVLIAGGHGAGHAVGGDGDVDSHALIGVAGQRAADAE